MISTLLLGFLIGMRHALEADHVAAVASLATRAGSAAQTVRLGVAWGLGHTFTLMLFGGAVLWLDSVVPEQLAQALEFAVGCMLILLGADVLRRLALQRIHFHTHQHLDGPRHFHAHRHVAQRPHDREAHRHVHPRGFPYRALLVGLMHGMAGSAALILLTLQTMTSPWLGMVYIAVFGIGSVAGMALLSIIIAVPLQRSARGLTWAHNALQLVIGVVTVTLGALVIYNTELTLASFG